MPWQLDNKIAFIRVEGRLFGDADGDDLKLGRRLPNSAGVAMTPSVVANLRSIAASVACCIPLRVFSKHPPVQMTDDEAYRCVEQFIRGERES